MIAQGGPEFTVRFVVIIMSPMTPVMEDLQDEKV